jgi:methionine synthase I (cobalamin-dependent)
VFISRTSTSRTSPTRLVKDVHLDYTAAGVDIIETNTFGGSRR